MILNADETIPKLLNTGKSMLGMRLSRWINKYLRCPMIFYDTCQFFKKGDKHFLLGEHPEAVFLVVCDPSMNEL